MRLPNVSSKYGAPMGRVDQPHAYSGYAAIQDMAHKFTLRCVPLNSGGYDSGGAYWGHGIPLFWAMNENGTIERWLRADDRRHAKLIVQAEFCNAKFWR